MQDSTLSLLLSIKDLAIYAQAHPTDTVGITTRRKARAAAETHWFAMGCPDLPAGVKKPTPIQRGFAAGETAATPGRGSGEELDGTPKDWTPVTVTLEVLSLTDGGAARCSDGITVAYAPASLLADPATGKPADLEPETLVEVNCPAWLLAEKGWKA